MFKKVPFLTTLLLLTLVTAAFAGVVIYSEGSRVGPTDKLLLVGPTVTESGSRTTVDLTEITGSLTVDDDIYSDAGLMADGSLYLTGSDADPSLIFLRQDDGGCSRCGVDTAGTSFSCVDVSCPAGMTQ
ncbi:MAG: hypothetical protein NG712_05755 [Omnitrophica bacterium]|nr:hypothetical protein [Candidatus Omnitrophota bacterium]